MSARAIELRKNAASLRAKAAASEVGVRVATDLSARLPKRLLAKLEADLKSGALEQRWMKHLDDADELGPDAEMGALAALLTELIADVGKEAREFRDALEAKRHEMLGRAMGIEEALPAAD